jgi:hypothetical protein
VLAEEGGSNKEKGSELRSSAAGFSEGGTVAGCWIGAWFWPTVARRVTEDDMAWPAEGRNPSSERPARSSRGAKGSLVFDGRCWVASPRVKSDGFKTEASGRGWLKGFDAR